MEQRKRNPQVLLEDVRLVFRNFSGNVTPMNSRGERNFGVILMPEHLERLERSKIDWNIKVLKPREEEDEPQPFLPVAMYFPRAGSKGRPPEVVLITDKIDPETGAVIGKSRTNLNVDTVSLLDWANIVHVDLAIRSFEWDHLGRTGIKAALNAIYVTIEMDTLQAKYANIEDSAYDSEEFTPVEED